MPLALRFTPSQSTPTMKDSKTMLLDACRSINHFEAIDAWEAGSK
jgi:hypothetical protein